MGQRTIGSTFAMAVITLLLLMMHGSQAKSIRFPPVMSDSCPAAW